MNFEIFKKILNYFEDYEEYLVDRELYPKCNALFFALDETHCKIKNDLFSITKNGFTDYDCFELSLGMIEAQYSVMLAIGEVIGDRI